MLPYIEKNGKIIIIGSLAGEFTALKSEKLLSQIRDENITKETLVKLADKFILDVKNNVYIQEGWVKNTYKTSKVLINNYPRVLAKY